jgi:putative tricarboxylic transport membrane protein
MAELTIRQSVILSNSNPAVLIDHPIAVVFLLLAVFSIWRFAIAGVRSMQLDEHTSTPEESVPQKGGL